MIPDQHGNRRQRIPHSVSPSVGARPWFIPRGEDAATLDSVRDASPQRRGARARILIGVLRAGVAVAVGFLLISGSPIYAQSASSANRDQPDQWVSHQMNQPPPELGRGRVPSPERVDEIRQLYELARKEAEARAKGKPGPSK
ncbi:MAG: hypothetical protein AB1733_08180 [Thermodesulfobacteriota bacterium]